MDTSVILNPFVAGRSFATWLAKDYLGDTGSLYPSPSVISLP
ncbi:unknown [Prevotella sp. CAG:592]|jgi:hypothetical protein|nr:unknown [Prevotella sp. CAG:592]